MDFMSDNIFIRSPRYGKPMKKDEVVLGHRHHFGHTTFAFFGPIELCLLNVSKVNAFDEPLEATVDETFILDPKNEVFWQTILAGRFHTLRALEEGARYVCVYAHRLPQAVTLERQGQLPEMPMTKRDADGLWIRVDEKIVQVTSEWADAYR